MKTIAIIPCFNEEHTIVDVIKETKKYVDKVIVVDSSTDSSPYLVKKFFTEVLLIREKKGKGRQIIRGIKEAKKYKPDYIAFIDSDGERDPSDIPKLLRKLKYTNADMIIGSRNKMRSLRRKFLNIFTAFWISFLIGFKFKDVESGFVIIKGDLLKKMKLKSKNFEIEIEIILEAYRNKLRIVQENISVPKITKSGFHVRDMFEISAFFDMWTLNYIRGKECELNLVRKLFLTFFCVIPLVLTGWSISELNYKF